LGIKFSIIGVHPMFTGLGDERVYEYCRGKGIPIMLEIPFSTRIAELYSKGIPLLKKCLSGKKV